MKCPYCGEVGASHVIETTTDSGGNVRRRRECGNCQNRFTTYERAILATPDIIKRSGRRESFNREKLLNSLKLACAKLPVSSDSLETLADRIESTLQKMGLREVPSKEVGDLALEGLKDLDPIAYIRFSLVYLKLDNLTAIREEIDKLIQENN